MSSDHSITMLRKVLRQIDIIKSSRSGSPNFEAHEVEANDLQAAVIQYLQFRGDRQVHVNASSKTMPSNMGIKGSSSRNVTLFIDTVIVAYQQLVTICPKKDVT
ncbi:hypothetical protein BC332_08206 [Capsicum chinense]|nr:hypothetical protein BC332_08206 [Capsicum chinense]